MSRRERRAQKREEETLVDLVEVKDQAQDFIEQNQKLILGVATAILLLFGAYLGYRNLIKKPQMQQAKSEIYQAEAQFEKDSFSLALSNPGGGSMGFIEIAEEFGGTTTGNTAKYYAGICFLRLGQYDNAIEYLESVKAKGDILPALKYGSLGDAYSEQQTFDKAIGNYRKAATSTKNGALSSYYLMKLAQLSELQGDKDSALKAYRQIRDKHGDAPEADQIHKFIARLES